jgi:predicted nucleotide-binding protein
MDLKPRACQNVWLEAGWFWGRLRRNRIMILSKREVEMPINLQGIELYDYNEKPSEKGYQLQLFVEKSKVAQYRQAKTA